METIDDKLRKYASPTPSKWREEARIRGQNPGRLKYSLRIAVKMLNRMEEELNLSEKAVACLLGCSQQHVSRILKGLENLSLEVISKISALQLQLTLIDN